MASLFRKVHEAHIEVADSCNLDCRYCYFVTKRKQLQGFPPSQFQRIVDRLFAESLEDINIVFHGGEPLLRSAEWFDEVCDLAKNMAVSYDKKIRFQLQTNGTLLTDDHIRVFKKHFVMVSVSLDGPSGIHDIMRGGYSKTVLAIRRLQQAGIFGSVIAVVCKHNYNRIGEIVDLFKDLDVKRYHFNIASIVGDDKIVVMSEDEMLNYYKDAYRTFAKHYKTLYDWILLGKL